MYNKNAAETKNYNLSLNIFEDLGISRTVHVVSLGPELQALVFKRGLKNTTLMFNVLLPSTQYL